MTESMRLLINCTVIGVRSYLVATAEAIVVAELSCVHQLQYRASWSLEGDPDRKYAAVDRLLADRGGPVPGGNSGGQCLGTQQQPTAHQHGTACLGKACERGAHLLHIRTRQRPQSCRQPHPFSGCGCCFTKRIASRENLAAHGKQHLINSPRMRQRGQGFERCCIAIEYMPPCFPIIVSLHAASRSAMLATRYIFMYEYTTKIEIACQRGMTVQDYAARTYQQQRGCSCTLLHSVDRKRP